jgi:hypothetical protein
MYALILLNMILLAYNALCLFQSYFFEIIMLIMTFMSKSSKEVQLWLGFWILLACITAIEIPWILILNMHPRVTSGIKDQFGPIITIYSVIRVILLALWRL